MAFKPPTRSDHMHKRKAQGISGKQVASEHGVHPSTVSRVTAPAMAGAIATPRPAPMLGAPMTGKGMGDNRAGRLSDVKTDRGTFRMKANRRGD